MLVINKIPDHFARARALDPTQSFIIQAPAGSGKTELLIQRFLVLLAQVEQPEVIVALTFTRKAAAEMQQRILLALRHAQQSPEPQAAHTRVTWQWARKVLERDHILKWDLLNNPSRLRIKTIDALCASLTKQLPVMAQFGAQPEITDDPTPLYRAAIRYCFEHMDEAHSWCDAFASLCLHLDNDLTRVEALCLNMLARRDQWLPLILHANSNRELRQTLECSLQHCVEDLLAPLPRLMAEIDSVELLHLARYAFTQLDRSIDLDQLPDQQLSSYKIWLSLADLLLTKDQHWRKQVTKANGFPAASSFSDSSSKARAQDYKQRMQTLLASLESAEALRSQLAGVMAAPPLVYTETQWQILQALLDLLPVLAAQLQVIFAKQQVVDFIAVTQSALQALGDADQPSDLALRLDYQIQHLLVDEFQDTSLTQYRLLEQLTAGWQIDDGRTLFLVGDPMQSIYRFRQAEVGLFLRAQQEGLGQVALNSLILSSNFRSDPKIVGWNNQAFKQIFPALADHLQGAVNYHQSQAVHDVKANAGVRFHGAQDPGQEAKQICELITAELIVEPEQSVAILVRSRSHLAAIIPALQNSAIAYHGVELDPLAQREVVQDLWSLTKAILHQADRLAWLAMLRAPWCAMQLTDLTRLAEDDTVTLWQQMQTPNVMQSLSEDGRQRVQRVLSAFTRALSQRQRLSLRDNVEATWLSLAGPACYSEQQCLADAEAFFELLSRTEIAGDLTDYDHFENQLVRLYAITKSDPTSRVEVMTIHKAKGLEFDTVILPSLDRSSARDEASLLLWTQQPREHGKTDLVLAPIKAKADQSDPIYHYVAQLEATKAQYEAARVLYVACTRAKQRLHLFASVGDSENSIKQPYRHCFLAKLWPYYSESFLETRSAAVIQQTAIDPGSKRLRRLIDPAGSEIRVPDYYYLPRGHNPVTQLTLHQQELNAQQVGIFVHRLLQVISEQGLEFWNEARVIAMQMQWRHGLLSLGILPREVDAALQTVTRAISNSLKDPMGQWILSSKHQDARSEYALSVDQSNQIKQVIIDRTFVCDGVRWIIDYKTSAADHQQQDQFIAAEVEKYQQQLQLYASILQKKYNEPIKCGLYFPLIPFFHEGRSMK